jgi:hypothetical protein
LDLIMVLTFTGSLSAQWGAEAGVRAKMLPRVG